MKGPPARSIHVSRSHVHYGWSNATPPVITVASGRQITLETQDASDGQVVPGASAQTIAALDFARVNPITGPVFVEGAKPGDVLKVDILEVNAGTYGWTANIPGFGLLADEFPDPWVYIWDLHTRLATLGSGIEVPLEPFCGVIGVAPATAGTLSVGPPTHVGGNMDVRQLTAGATVYLPIEVDGALFGVGDGHGAQGDGEVCGTGIEMPLTVTTRLTVQRGRSIRGPQFEISRALERRASALSGYYVTTGIDADLMESARDATRQMILHLADRHRLGQYEAYALCSVAMDLRISEIVNSPNWLVSAFMPNDVFTSLRRPQSTRGRRSGPDQ